jgi:PilZ domain-containing protein
MRSGAHRTVCYQLAEFTGLTVLRPTQGEGYTSDVSVKGCRIETDSPVEAHRYLSLRIDFATSHATRSPVVIEVARVRWVARHCFGVEFIKVSARNRERLEEYLASRDNKEASHG